MTGPRERLQELGLELPAVAAPKGVYVPARRTGDVVACVVNFGGDSKEWLRVGVPFGGRWRVILDTSGYDQHSTPSQADLELDAVEEGWNNQPFHVTVRLAGLTAVYLAPVQPRPLEGSSVERRTGDEEVVS